MKRRVLLAASVVAALVGAGVFYRAPAGNPAPATAPPTVSPTVPAHVTVNGGEDRLAAARSAKDHAAGYIGISACAECHAAQHRSYLETAHSRALEEIDLAVEPADGQFEHAKSGRSYRVYRQEGRLRHREWLTADEELAADHPILYAIGSGRHTRSYLIEDDGFLAESPITWYASRQAWGLSPGYDQAWHLGFERAADLGCVTCHVGRAEAQGGSFNRVVIHEQAIGCERCHGPGQEHATRRKAVVPEAAARDETIVNPALLSRDLQEAVCAQCHLRSQATVFLSGRDVNDMRPGRPLTDFRVDYQFDVPSDQMTVVGHVEQLRASRCREASARLTCTTCHDPHAAPDAAAKASYYLAKCLECHSEASCGLPLGDRLTRDQGGRCVTCHMPQVETNVPHVAFTHHRIGIHNEAPAGRARQMADLAPMGDISQVPDDERDRALALAYLELSDAQSESAPRRHYRRRARELLSRVQIKHADADIEAALARLDWESSSPRAAQSAQAAFNAGGLSPGARLNVLFVLGDTYCQAHDWSGARHVLGELLTLRRHSEDWRLFGICQAESGDLAAGAESLKRAVRINPFRAELHADLARVLIAAGRNQAAQRHQRLAQELRIGNGL